MSRPGADGAGRARSAAEPGGWDAGTGQGNACPVGPDPCPDASGTGSDGPGTGRGRADAGSSRAGTRPISGGVR